MEASTGVLLGMIGLAAFMVGLIWFVLNYYKNISTKLPTLLLVVSIILCIIGYFLTPTGTANMQLIIKNMTNARGIIMLDDIDYKRYLGECIISRCRFLEVS